MNHRFKRQVSRLLLLAGAISLASVAQISAAAAACTPEQTALIAKGGQSWERRCAGCHSLDQNRIGPKHRGVYGRKAGVAEGFRYSKALQSLDVVWTEETLDAWLTNPVAFAPGTSMGFRLAQPEDRTAVIAWLKSVSPEGESCAP